MADIINTSTACSEDISYENNQTVDNNSKYLGFRSSCNFIKPKRKEKLKDNWSLVDSVKGGKADEENKNMVEENKNDQADSVVFNDSNEEDHYSDANEINITNNDEKLQEKVAVTNKEKIIDEDFKEIVENEDPNLINSPKVMPIEHEHCNNDQSTDYKSSLVRNEDKRNSNITRKENDIQTNSANNSDQNNMEDQDSLSNMHDVLESDDNSVFSEPVPTLKELAESDYIHNRQLAARKIFESLKQAKSNEELQSVTAVMYKLIEDEEILVRLELVEYIPSIALHFQDDPFVKIVIRQQLIPYIVKLISEIIVIPEIRAAGQSVLLNFLENNLIDQSQLTEWICPLVVQMAMCESNPAEVIAEDVSFMTKMIPLVGKEITLKFFLEPYISLCNRLAFEIRKICALGFGNLCCIVGEETTELSLLPIFLKLCNDRTFGVRKACAEVFIDVAKSVSLKSRKEILPQVFLSLLSDEHHYVKHVAYKSLGGFIHTFAKSYSSSDKSLSSSTENLSAESSIAANLNTEPSKLENTNELKKNEHTFSQPQKNSRFKKFKENKCLQRMHEKVTKLEHQKSLAVAAKDGHVYLHVNNDNLFNNFQFWRIPLPEVELDIDIEPGKATNIHIRAKVQNMEDAPASEIQVRVEPEQQPDSESTNSSSIKKMLVRTSCMNNFITRDKQSLLDDDSVFVQSSFNKSILAFKDDPDPCMPEELIPVNQVTLNSDSVYSRSIGSIASTSGEEPRKKSLSKMTAFDQDIVPPTLLNSFISPVHYYPFSEVAKEYDDEIMGYIAYSFPAVALTLGPKYWPCIKGTCEALARDMIWTVRRTIAASLHELADILGYEIIMADLFPIFLDLLKDVDEVRLRLVQHLSDFLKHVTPHDRKQFLPLIDDFTVVDSEKNWRFRFALAEQLKRTAELYDAVEISEYFLPIASSLFHDKISSVRLAAVELMAFLLKRLYQDSRTESSFKSMLDGVDSLYRLSPKWLLRQTYVRLCEELAKQESISLEDYAELIVPKLFSLAWDAVPNIRLAVMRCIVKTLLPMGMMPLLESDSSSQELLHKVLDWMKYDTDNDVRHFAVMYNNVSQNFVSP